MQIRLRFARNGFTNLLRGSAAALIALVLLLVLVRHISLSSFAVWVLLLQAAAHFRYLLSVLRMERQLFRDTAVLYSGLDRRHRQAPVGCRSNFSGAHGKVAGTHGGVVGAANRHSFTLQIVIQRRLVPDVRFKMELIKGSIIREMFSYVSITKRCLKVDMTHPYEEIDAGRIGILIAKDNSFVEIGDGAFIVFGAVNLLNVWNGSREVLGQILL
jgi:hypothetical protein